MQVAPEDCTGCTLCVQVCPAKNKTETRLKAINMVPQPPIREQEAENWKFFLGLPEMDRRVLSPSVKDAQLLQPLFEFSGACGGCGETPYVKLVSPTLWRPRRHRECHGLFFDLRRQPADHAVGLQR